MLYSDAVDDREVNKGRADPHACSDVSDAADPQPPVGLPTTDCARDGGCDRRAPRIDPGDSLGPPDPPTQARKMLSLMGQVKRARVRCDSARAAKRSMFFCEKVACILVGSLLLSTAASSAPVSSDATPLPSGSTGGDARRACLSRSSCSSASRCPGTKCRSERRCIIAGRSSVNKTRSWASISFCK